MYSYRQSSNEEDAKVVAKAIVSVFNKSESAAVIDLILSYTGKGYLIKVNHYE